MNKIFKLFMLAVVVLGFSSCYNEFEEPAPAKVWTKEDFSIKNTETVQPVWEKLWKSQKTMSSAEKSSQATKPVMYTNQYTSMMNHPNQPLN